ncbi:MAG: endo-1,4-beta-xylanase [Marinilabiliales bacterium]|nr:MAG: endo-1,4-beta-xylanase [Marinilabiliales bacterium]
MRNIVFSLPALFLVFSSCGSPPDDSLPRLKELYSDAFVIGTAMNRSQIYGRDTASIELIETHFNTITPENITKWQHIQPEPGVFNFEPADLFVEFGERNDMFMVGHTLVWHSQTPAWVFQDEYGNLPDRETLIERMRDHIHTVVGRYKGRIHGWDVVNEALNEDGTLRESVWYQVIGPEYLVKAFNFAREADPEAELYYNDYNLEDPVKRAGAVKLVKYLQENGAPVTGIGTQSHLHLTTPPVTEIEKTITDFAALGIDVMVTELEIDVLPYPSGYFQGIDRALIDQEEEGINPFTDKLPDEVQEELAERYREVFEVYLKHRDVITRVTFWGVNDLNTWKNNYPVRGRTNHPLLFDREWQPKPAFYEVAGIAREVIPE